MPSNIGGCLIPSGSQPSTVIGGKTYTPAASYPSKSDPTKDYTVCEVNDGTLSCDCLGWTRRNPPGGRTCKHVEDYDMFLRHDRGKSSAAEFFDTAAEKATARKPKEGEKGGSLSDLFERLEKGGL
jgi:hypothetical protein